MTFVMLYFIMPLLNSPVNKITVMSCRLQRERERERERERMEDRLEREKNEAFPSKCPILHLLQVQHTPLYHWMPSQHLHIFRPSPSFYEVPLS